MERGKQYACTGARGQQSQMPGNAHISLSTRARTTEQNFAHALDFAPTQHYCCVVIPDCLQHGLPAGLHHATWDEIVERFGFTEFRRVLLSGLLLGATNLKAAGCLTLYLDGSFVSEKRTPPDFDACWDPNGVDLTRLDPVLLTFDRDRFEQKAKFGGEFFPSTTPADAFGNTFLEFFQTDREGNAKGLIVLDLRSLKP